MLKWLWSKLANKRKIAIPGDTTDVTAHQRCTVLYKPLRKLHVQRHSVLRNHLFTHSLSHWSKSSLAVTAKEGWIFNCYSYCTIMRAFPTRVMRHVFISNGRIKDFEHWWNIVENKVLHSAIQRLWSELIGQTDGRQTVKAQPLQRESGR